MNLLVATRASQWWIYKIGPVLAFAFVAICLHRTPPARATLLVCSLLISLAGIAAFGHIINDIFDVESDRQAGKENRLSQWSRLKQVSVALLLFGAGFLPWSIVEIGVTPLLLLVGLVVCLVVYSAPPLRLKERGVYGILTDATYGHLIPTLFALTLFDGPVNSQRGANTLMVGAALWGFCFGVRGIMIHQIRDYDADLLANIRTFVAVRGPERARRLALYFVFPVELIALVVMLVGVGMFAPAAFYTLIVWSACWWVNWYLRRQCSLLWLDPLPVDTRNPMFLSRFYNRHAAAVFAVYLIVIDLRYVSLIVLFAALFPVGKEVVRVRDALAALWVNIVGCRPAAKIDDVLKVETQENSGSISAEPNPVPAGTGKGTTTILWTGDGSFQEVYVAINGAAEIRCWGSAGKAGSFEAPWINAGGVYEFRLYRGREDKVLIAAVNVIRKKE